MNRHLIVKEDPHCFSLELKFFKFLRINLYVLFFISLWKANSNQSRYPIYKKLYKKK